jgi:hypothetical protein
VSSRFLRKAKKTWKWSILSKVKEDDPATDGINHRIPVVFRGLKFESEAEIGGKKRGVFQGCRQWPWIGETTMGKISEETVIPRFWWRDTTIRSVRSALPSSPRGILSDSLRESPQKIGIADRPDAVCRPNRRGLPKRPRHENRPS